MKKLSREEIQKIESLLLKLNIKFIDVRLELTDHLATEFEQNSEYVLLEDFLKTKVNFIKDFETKRQKTIHWSYQKKLWNRLAMFFYKPIYIPITFSLFSFVYWLQSLQPNKTSVLVLITSLATIHFTAIILSLKDYKALKKLQFAQPLYAIMALPSLFLYTMGAAKPLLENQYFFIAFWFLAILFNIAGIITLYHKRNQIVDYSKLIFK